MSYTRLGVLSGQSLSLKTVFTDDTGMPIDADALPEVYIYDESVDLATIQSEVEAATYTSALAGPLSPTNLSTGFYELDYMVPSGSNEGTWHDVWVADIDTLPVSSILMFEVKTGADISDQALSKNKLLVIELDSTIASTGLTPVKTLGQDIIVGFSTIYTPLYASPTLLRMEAGALLGVLPDDTLALMLYWSSKEADFIARNPKHGSMIAFARAKYVVYDTILRIINLPGGLSGMLGGPTFGGSKRLGNLDISNGRSSSLPTNSAGIDTNTVQYFREQRDLWFKVVNGGATTVPGQSFAPAVAVPGIRAPRGRRNSGRLWESPNNRHFPQPTANVKYRESLYEPSRFRFLDRWIRIDGGD